MDVTVKRENSSLRTDIYRKPTWPIALIFIKFTVVYVLAKRIIYISAGEGAVTAEHRRIDADLLKDGYLQTFFHY